MEILEIYTDGSASPNPGAGVAAFVVLKGKNKLHEEVFSSEDATNNIMELTAVIKALEFVDKDYKEHRVYVYTDSQYVQMGITEWLTNWKKRNWRTANGKAVSNKELWQQLDKLCSKITTHFQWIRGHNGNKWNSHVDAMCTEQHRKRSKQKQ